MIDYQKYINALRKCAKEHDNDTTYTGHIIVSDLCRDTANLLEALEQKPKIGHWIKSNIGGAKVCSVCNAHMGLSSFKFCPNCGAKMESED